MRKADVAAILCSDIHLSHRAPIARSVESNWYEAMSRPLRELTDLSRKHDAPIICAGDIFDRWNSPPELINFALNELPEMWTIPGQHDLPNHSYEEMRRSAYWTLVEAGKIHDVFTDPLIGRLRLWGFPWGYQVAPCTAEQTEAVNIAVIHAYCWTGQFKYPQAPKEQRLSAIKKSLKGYSIAVFGDNHLGFVRGNVCNCGGLMRRNMDQIDYKPFVGLYHTDGSISQHFLDTSKDRFIDSEKEKEPISLNLSVFLNELRSIGPDSLDFRGAVHGVLNSREMTDGTRRMILEAIGDDSSQ